MKTTIIINKQKKDFHFLFGMKVFIKLGKLWGLNTLQEVIDRCGRLADLSENIPLEAMETMADMIAISGNLHEDEAYQVMELFLFEKQDLLKTFFDEFAASFPTPKEDVNPESRGKQKAVKPTA
jgi:hypothetical protein